jgi:arylsulfatase A
MIVNEVRMNPRQRFRKKLDAAFLTLSFVALLQLLLPSFALAASKVPNNNIDKPNVILIVTDDQGYGDVGAYGASDIETPNLDRLAASGVRFSQFYAASAVCSPSRAAIMTGKVPHRAGVPGNVSHDPKKNQGVPSKEITMAELAKQSGYATAQIGKWHLGAAKGKTPNDQGFDYSFGHAGGCIDNYSHFFYWKGPNRHDLQRNGTEIFREGEYFPDMMVQESIDFIDRSKNTPFFIYFAMNTPHYPYQGDAKWLKHYQEKGTPYPRDLYSAFVSSLDERIGRLLDELEKRNLDKNTVIMFQTDHGHSTEERAHYGGGSAGIYRGAKFSLFEGGIRVPAMISWPGKIPQNEVRDELVTGVDWFATLADILNTDISNLDVNGRSMMPVVKSASEPSAHKDFVWHLSKHWAIRQGDWKLLLDPVDTGKTRHGPPLPEKDKIFLVNLKKDPSETTNVAKQHPDIVKKLLAVRDEHQKTY